MDKLKSIESKWCPKQNTEKEAVTSSYRKPFFSITSSAPAVKFQEISCQPQFFSVLSQQSYIPFNYKKFDFL